MLKIKTSLWDLFDWILARSLQDKMLYWDSVAHCRPQHHVKCSVFPLAGESYLRNTQIMPHIHVSSVRTPSTLAFEVFQLYLLTSS